MIRDDRAPSSMDVTALIEALTAGQLSDAQVMSELLHREREIDVTSERSTSYTSGYITSNSWR